MRTETATIRVPRRTRNLFVDQARARGVSVSALLAELAERSEREEIFRSEREAQRRDASNPAVQAEEREWDSVTADGID